MTVVIQKQKQDALKELHAKATEKANEIDQRIDLTEEEKDLAHTVIVANYEAGEEAINNATTAEEVAEAKQAGLDSLDQITIDGEAKQDALKELHAKATEKANEIDQRIDLTEEEKDLAHTVIVANYEAGEEAINNATTAEEVAEAKQAGLDSLDQITIDGEAKQDALKELHAKATEKANEIDQRIDLTEEEKDLAHTVIVANYEAGEEAINNATTAEEVAEAKQAGLDSLDQITIDGEAKQEAQNELHKVAQVKENEIEERIDLTEDEKTEAATKLVEEYNKAVEAINSAETNDDVTTAKDAGIQAINDIQLTPAAKQEAQNELHKVAQAKENEIEERIDLTEDEKTEAATKLVEEYNKAVEAINSAETNDDVTTAKDAGIQAINDIQLTPAAKQEAQNELHKVAQTKENEIEERIDLTEDEKTEAATKLVEEYNKAVEAINSAEINDDVTTAKDAGIQAINDIQLIPAAKQEAQNELHKVAQTKENEIEERIDLTEDEKTEAATKLVEEYNKAVEAINSAETNDDVTTAKDAGIQAINDIQLTPAAKQEAQNELHKVAQTKENEIEERIDLTEDEKTEAATKLVEEYNKAVEAINSAETNDDVTTAKDAGIQAINDIQLTPAAKQEAQNELHKVAQTKENEIEERIDLTEDEKTEAATKLVEEYNKAVEAINSAETNDDVTTAKDAGIQAINDIQLIPAAKQEAQNELHKVAQTKENEIEERDDLTAEEKFDAADKLVGEYNKAVEAINNAETNDDVTTAKDAGIQAINDIELDGQTKGEAIKNIDALPELTEEQKDTFKQQIDAAENEEEILEILSKAGNRNELNKEVKEAIDGIPELTDDQRDKYKKEVEEATSDDEVESVLSELENQAYENYKGEAKDNIDALPGLTDDQKEQLKGEVDEAANSIEVGSVLDKAEKQAFENYKGEAKDNIDALPGLTNDQKATLKGEVDEATSPAEVGTVLDKAEEQAFNNELAVAKEGALADIADLDFHTPSEKDELEAKVNAAQNPDDFAKVDEAISEAIEENDRRHQRAEERGLGYPQTIHVAPDNKKRSDSTDIPTLPADIVKEDGDTFHFGENLPEGFEVNPNPSWHGVEEIVFKGNDKSEEILFRLNKQNGKVEVHAGENASYDRPNEKLPVKYVGADGTVKGFDRVSALIRPASPTDDSDQTPPVEDSGSTDAGTEQGTGDQTPGQGDTGSTGDSTEDSSPDDGATDEGTTTDQDGTGSNDVDTPPTDGTGEGDTGSEQGTGDQAPGQGDSEGDTGSTEDGSTGEGTPDEGTTSDQDGAGSTEDGSTSTGEDSGTTEETDPATDDESFNPTAVDKPIIIEGSDVNGSNISNKEHDKIKKGVQNAPENAPIEIVSDVQVGEDGIARVDVEVTDPTGTSKPKIISVPVKQNELIKQINQGLGDLATHEKDKKPKPINKETVTVADQEKFRKYNETLNQKKDKIQKLLNDDANAEEGKKKLSEEKRKELQDELDKYKPVKTPKTEIQLARILLGEGKKHNVQDLRDRAVHLLVGVDKNGKQYGSGNGHGLIRYNTINFGDGDDTFELYNGMGIGSTVNLGNGNNEFVIHGKVSGYTTFINDKDSRSVVNGGDGIDTVTLTNTANQQRIWDVNVPKFDRVNLNGSGGQFNVKYQNIVDKQLGGNGPLIVSGVAGKNNSVDFNYGTTSIENKPGSTFDADGTWVAVKKVKKDGKTYVVWRNKKDSNIKPQHEVWVEDTLNVRY
ncbi:DUF1542 domain-containing protein [Dolosigranulum pigrum]|nr:DUF1542 domain-containing protein [Dolosigranulum pigrum]